MHRPCKEARRALSRERVPAAGGALSNCRTGTVSQSGSKGRARNSPCHAPHDIRPSLQRASGDARGCRLHTCIALRLSAHARTSRSPSTRASRPDPPPRRRRPRLHSIPLPLLAPTARHEGSREVDARQRRRSTGADGRGCAEAVSRYAHTTPRTTDTPSTRPQRPPDSLPRRQPRASAHERRRARDSPARKRCAAAREATGRARARMYAGRSGVWGSGWAGFAQRRGRCGQRGGGDGQSAACEGEGMG